MISSLLMATLGGAWATGRLWFHTPGTELDRLSVLPHLPMPVLVGVPVMLGLTGAVAGARATGPLLAAVAWVQALVFVVVAGDLGVLLTLGYVMALGFPVALVTLLVIGARSSRVARLALLALLVASTTVVLTSEVFTVSSVRGLGSGLLAGMRENLPPHLVTTFLTGHGLLWAVAGAAIVGGRPGVLDRSGREGSRSVGEPRSFGPQRWGTPVTLLAAACALPYALNRLSWLVGGAPDGVDATPGVTAMGVLLGLASVTAAVLTVGLVRPWGRTFPGWLPALGSRAVPALPPALAAMTVGVVMTVAGKSLVQGLVMEQAAGGDPPWSFLVLVPLPVWGPALVLAGYAYLARSGPPTMSGDISREAARH
ncbi:hypothetical protein [Nocardioides sp.]|uniref:hypothetical protein n=1 Tax=Nocardioides sp. TaxID=35761 RepID=UPI002733705E|nr:hypothetical protein [Nocardioides sp.]MDP3890338.1 hypothetical protein [Nocardioides sp.]